MKARLAKRRRLLVATVLTVATVCAFGTSAHANDNCTPTYGQHCYGIATWPQTSAGGSTALAVQNMTVANSSDFVTQEIWVGTAYNGSFSYWVEGGYVNGSGLTSMRWFWADSRPNGGGYHAHYPGGLPSPASEIGQTVPMTIYSVDSTTWNVLSYPYLLGQSTNNPCCSLVLQTGTEATYTGDVNHYPNASTTLQWFNLFGWSNGWSYNGNNAYTSTVSPFTTSAWYLPQYLLFDGMN